jgi:hypothetical protein
MQQKKHLEAHAVWSDIFISPAPDSLILILQTVEPSRAVVAFMGDGITIYILV